MSGRAAKAANDEERVPLLEAAEKGEGYKSAESIKEQEEEEEERDAMTYQLETLSTLSVLTYSAGTVWSRSQLWIITGQLFLISMVTAVLVLLICEDPSQLKISKFAKLGTFLNVFVGLLLGFFMSSSVTRWYGCTSGFLELFDAIRNLQMQFIALGLESRKMDDVLGYAVMSAWLLSHELRLDVMPEAQKRVAREAMWENFRVVDSADHHSRGGQARGLTLQDEKNLRQVRDCSGLLWMWVDCMIGRMAQDGDIPPMASPTYGRIMDLAGSAHDGIRQVRQSVGVQPPYIYVQMLASLVHFNNIINALSFGLTLGSWCGVFLMRYRNQLGISGTGYDGGTSKREVVQDTQNLLVAFFLSVFGPFVYIALLEVGIAVAQPFSSKEGEIPTLKLLNNLEHDLKDGREMGKSLPGKWTLPHFKKPAEAAPATGLAALSGGPAKPK